MKYILIIVGIFYLMSRPDFLFAQDISESAMLLHQHAWHHIKLLLFDRSFWVTALGWLTACFFKVIILKIKTNSFHWKQFFATGGMPSSHSAFASCLTVGIGLSEGFTSAVFGLALGLTILTAVDAVGLRHEAGLQAERINQILSDMYKDQHRRPEYLRETLGHTLPEVLGGILVGVSVAVLINVIFPL